MSQDQRLSGSQRPDLAENGAAGISLQLPAMAPKRFVYLIQSAPRADRHYVGLTSELTNRLTAHNAGESPHTRKYRPWRLVVSIAFESEAKAVQFEKYLKSGSGAAFLKRHLL